jgi:DnaK suppressor protein
LATKRKAAAEGGDVYRRMLLEKRAQVLSGLGSKSETLAGIERATEDEQAQYFHEEFVTVHLNSLDFAQLRLVEEALERLNSGDYGVCLCCEDRIPAKRLNAISWARYCVKCQANIAAQSDPEPTWWPRGQDRL